MRISVKVRPGSKEEKVLKLSAGSYEVHVKARPQEGKANHAAREALANHLGIPKSRVMLIRGEKSKNKIFEIIS